LIACGCNRGHAKLGEQLAERCELHVLVPFFQFIPPCLSLARDLKELIHH
jgi:hypothetical protein